MAVEWGNVAKEFEIDRQTKLASSRLRLRNSGAEELLISISRFLPGVRFEMVKDESGLSSSAEIALKSLIRSENSGIKVDLAGGEGGTEQKSEMELLISAPSWNTEILDIVHAKITTDINMDDKARINGNPMRDGLGSDQVDLNNKRQIRECILANVEAAGFVPTGMVDAFRKKFATRAL